MVLEVFGVQGFFRDLRSEKKNDPSLILHTVILAGGLGFRVILHTVGVQLRVQGLHAIVLGLRAWRIEETRGPPSSWGASHYAEVSVLRTTLLWGLYPY